MAIRVEIYVDGGVVTGIVAGARRLRDLLETGEDVEVERARWAPIDGAPEAMPRGLHLVAGRVEKRRQRADREDLAKAFAAIPEADFQHLFAAPQTFERQLRSGAGQPWHHRPILRHVRRSRCGGLTAETG